MAIVQPYPTALFWFRSVHHYIEQNTQRSVITIPEQNNNDNL